MVGRLGMTTDVTTAAQILGIGRTLAFDLLKHDEFPVRVLRIGRRVVVPIPDLLRLLGAEPSGPDVALLPVLSQEAGLVCCHEDGGSTRVETFTTRSTLHRSLFGEEFLTDEVLVIRGRESEDGAGDGRRELAECVAGV